jgi:hypothetical protein
MKKIFALAFCAILSAPLSAKEVPPPPREDKPKAKPAPQRAVPADLIKQLIEQRLNKRQLGAIPPPQMVQPVPGFGLGFRQPGRPSTSRTSIPTLKKRKQVEAVYLINGDILQGKFISYNEKGGLVWRHPNIKPDLKIDPKQIARITFAPRPKTAAKQMRSRVSLANGDQLAGDLSELTYKKLLLNTWYAGQITIDRKAVRTLVPGEIPLSVFYEGPRDAKQWTFSNPNLGAGVAIPFGRGGAKIPPAALQQMQAMRNAQWKLKAGAFQSSGRDAYVGRQFPKMGDRTNIEFDVAWGGSLSLYVNFYTDNLKSYSQGNTYSLRLSQTSAYMYKYESQPGRMRSSRIGNTVRYNLSSIKQEAHMSIRVDKTKKLILLVINGKQVAKWNDPGKFAGKGKGLLFSARTTNPMQVGNIRLSEWDGQTPSEMKLAGKDIKEDFIELANKDILTGTLLDIKRGQMNFKPDFSDAIPIPLKRVSLIRMATVKAPAAATNPIRATLSGRGQITATLKQWKDGKVTLSSPTFGETIIDAKAIESIQFNLDKTAKTASLPTPVNSGSSTAVNINGLNNLQGLLNGRQNFGGAKIEIIPGGGIRIEQNLKILPRRVPKRR